MAKHASTLYKIERLPFWVGSSSDIPISPDFSHWIPLDQQRDITNAFICIPSNRFRNGKYDPALHNCVLVAAAIGGVQGQATGNEHVVERQLLLLVDGTLGICQLVPQGCMFDASFQAN